MCATFGEGICARVACGCGDEVHCWLRLEGVREGRLRMVRLLGERRAAGEAMAGGGAGVPASESDGDSSELMSMAAAAAGGLMGAAGPRWRRHRRHETRRCGQGSGRGSNQYPTRPSVTRQRTLTSGKALAVRSMWHSVPSPTPAGAKPAAIRSVCQALHLAPAPSEFPDCCGTSHCCRCRRHHHRHERPILFAAAGPRRHSPNLPSLVDALPSLVGRLLHRTASPEQRE